MDIKRFTFQNNNSSTIKVDISIVDTPKGKVRTIEINDHTITNYGYSSDKVRDIIFRINDFDNTSINKEFMIEMCEYLLEELKK